MKKIVSLLFAFCTILAFLPNANAGVDIFSGGFSSASNLKYAYNTSVTSSSDKAIIDASISQWNGISSKVKIAYSSATNQYGSTADIICTITSFTPSTPGETGICFMYKTPVGPSAGTPAEIWDRWVLAIPTIYIVNIPNNENNKKKVMTHEIGHALSLAHPYNSSVQSVMNQGASTVFTPSSEDISTLRYKWGN